MSFTRNKSRIIPAMIASLLATVLMFSSVVLATGCAASSDQGSSASASSDGSTAAGSTLAEPLTVASMKGATSIGLASMMQDDTEDDDYVFEMYAAADEIAPKLVSGDVDIALIPANLAATLYGKTDGGIQVIDINTLGVLYALTADADLKALDGASMADLAGRTIYMSGKGTVPEYTVRCLLQAAGLDEASVSIEFCSEPTEAVARLAAAPDAVGIVPQPFATAALMQNDQLASIMDLSEQWDLLAVDEDSDLPDNGRMVTGVTVARTSVIEEHPDAIADFLEAHRASAEVADTDPSAIAAEVVELGIVGKEAIAEAAIPLCNIVCITGDDMEEALSGYLEALFALAPEAVGGSLPPDEFYFLGWADRYYNSK